MASLSAPAASYDAGGRSPSSPPPVVQPDVLELMPCYDEDGNCTHFIETFQSIVQIDDDDDDTYMVKGPIVKLTEPSPHSSSTFSHYEHDPSFCWAFCCMECKCSLKRKLRFGVNDKVIETAVIGSGLLGCLWHRRCCHGVSQTRQTYRSSIEMAENKFVDGTTKVAAATKASTNWTLPQVRCRIEASAVSHDRKMGKVMNAALVHTNPVSAVLTAAIDQPAMFKDFDQLVERSPAKRTRTEVPRSELAVTVLDLFAGTGAGLVALKRQGIRVGLYLYFEHCPVAKHVFRWNHDPDYNRSLPNEGIRFLYYRKFEEVFEEVDHDLNQFMRTLGPIDIVFAAPPCVDFTRMNAHAKGIHGEQGKLTPMAVALIDRIKSHRKQSRSLFFVVENVTDFEVVQALKPLGVPPIRLQAALFSPTFRERHFWTNVRPNEEEFIGTTEASASLDGCLDDEYMSPLTLDENAPDHVVNKSLTLLASKGRHDPDDFLVYRLRDDGTLDSRTLTGAERGRIMGFPEGYASAALEVLFRKLAQVHAFVSTEQFLIIGEYERYQSLCDDVILQDFRGEPVQCAGVDPSTSEFKLKLFPPRVKPDDLNENRVGYDQEAYEKRLWGNAWNIPSMEKLLIPLKPLFASKEYQGYPYTFRWEASDA